MSFLTPEQIINIRKKGSKLITLDALDGKQIRIVKMSSTAQLESEAMQVKVRAGATPQADFLRFMLQNACTDVEGVPLTEKDAADLFDVLPLDEVSILIKEISLLIDGSIVKIKKLNGPPVEETAAEKKGEAS